MTESNNVNASSIIQVATNLQTGVQNVMSHGCADTQVNFVNPINSGYTNSNAPSDNSCNVFDPNGGSISFPTITASTLETNDGGHFVFEGNIMFYNIGSQMSLIAFLPIDSRTLCQQINTELSLGSFWGGGDYITPATPTTGHFTGTYYWGDTIPGIGSWPTGPMMGCLEEAYGGAYLSRSGNGSPINANYFFFVILLERPVS